MQKEKIKLTIGLLESDNLRFGRMVGMGQFFSIKSLNGVNEWLGRLEQDNWDVEELFNLCFMVGYLIQVTERQIGVFRERGIIAK